MQTCNPYFNHRDELNMKVDYLIIRHEDSRMCYKGGVPWAEAIRVRYKEVGNTLEYVLNYFCYEIHVQITYT